MVDYYLMELADKRGYFLTNEPDPMSSVILQVTFSTDLIDDHRILFFERYTTLHEVRQQIVGVAHNTEETTQKAYKLARKFAQQFVRKNNGNLIDLISRQKESKLIEAEVNNNEAFVPINEPKWP